jgi:hypothetical protein
VIGREIVAPSLAREPRKGDTDSVSKLRLIREVMGEYMGLPENHPAVARACISLISPFLVLLMTDRPTLRRIFAGAGLAPIDADALIEDIHCYTLAGLAALANRSRKSGTAGAPPIRDGAGRKPRRTPAKKTAAS